MDLLNRARGYLLECHPVLPSVLRTRQKQAVDIFELPLERSDFYQEQEDSNRWPHCRICECLRKHLPDLLDQVRSRRRLELFSHKLTADAKRADCVGRRTNFIRGKALEFSVHWRYNGDRSGSPDYSREEHRNDHHGARGKPEQQAPCRSALHSHHVRLLQRDDYYLQVLLVHLPRGYGGVLSFGHGVFWFRRLFDDRSHLALQDAVRSHA